MSSHVGRIREKATSLIRSVDLLWTVPIALSLVVVLQGTYSVPIDMVIYSMWGVEFLELDFTSFAVRPVFPFLLAAAFRLLGTSFEAGFWVIRLTAVANVVLVYIVGKYVYRRSVGFVAATLLATSYTVTKWSLRHLDALVAGSILLAAFGVYYSFEKDTRRWYVFGGLALGGSVLVKEISLFLFPLPLLLFGLRYYEETQPPEFARLAELYLATSVPVMLWLLLIAVSGGTATDFFTEGAFDVLFTSIIGGGGEGGSSSDVLGVVNIVSSPFTFFKLYIYSQLALYPLVVVSWIYACHRTWGKRDGTVSLIASMVLLGPFFVYITLQQYRVGQILVFYLVSFIFVGIFLVDGAEWLATVASDEGVTAPHWLKKVPFHRNVLLAILVVTVPVLFQVYGAANASSRYIEGSQVNDLLRGQPTDLVVQSRFNTGYGKDVAQFLQNRSLNDRTMVFVPAPLRHEATFYAHRSLDTEQALALPSVRPRFEQRNQPLEATEPGVTSVNDISSEHLLFMDVENSEVSNNFVSIVTQEDLLEMMDSQNTKYVAVTTEWEFMRTYFDQHPGFEAQYTRPDITIYQKKSRDPQPIQFTPRVSPEVPDYIQTIEQDNSTRIQWFKTEVFKQLVGLNKSEYAALKSGNPGPFFEFSKTTDEQ